MFLSIALAKFIIDDEFPPRFLLITQQFISLKQSVPEPNN